MKKIYAKDYGFTSLPGRKFRNDATGEILTRRKFDETVGRLADTPFKTPEKLAKYNRGLLGEKQLMRPAPGRKKISESLSKPIQNALIDERIEKIQRKKLDEKILKAAQKSHKVPATISLKNFQPGKMGRRFLVSANYDDMKSVIDKAKKYRGALGYSYGIIFADTNTHKIGAESLVGLRGWSMPFTESIFDDLIDHVHEKSYMRLLSCFVYIALKRQVAEKYAKKKKK